MRFHIYSPDYGESGVLSECLVCGTRYDKGDHYLQRPCPTCGACDMEATSYPELVNGVVGFLIHQKGLTNREIVEAIGIKPSTLKAWRYKWCGASQFERFVKAVRKLVEREKGE